MKTGRHEWGTIHLGCVLVHEQQAAVSKAGKLSPFITLSQHETKREACSKYRIHKEDCPMHGEKDVGWTTGMCGWNRRGQELLYILEKEIKVQRNVVVKSKQEKKVDLRANSGEQACRTGCLYFFFFQVSVFLMLFLCVCFSFQIACLVPVDQFQLYKRLKFERGENVFASITFIF